MARWSSFMRIPSSIDRWYFVLPLLLYLATCATRMGLPDSVIIVDEMAGPVISSHVNCHNLNNLLGWLCLRLPGGNEIWKANLSSVVAMTAAMALFHRVLLATGLARGIAFLVASAMCVSHSVWWHGTQADSYALSAVFFCGLFLLTLCDVRTPSAAPGRFDLLCALAGFSVFNHLQNGALCLGVAAYVLTQTRRGPTILRCALAAALGALPYFLVLIRDLSVAADRAQAAAWATGGGFRELMFRYQWFTAASRLCHWVVLQFPSPVLLLIPVGLWAMRRASPWPRAWVFPATVFLVDVAFFAGYETWDQFAFYLPCFLVLGWLAGQGAQWLSLVPHFRRFVHAALVVSVALPPIVLWHIPDWVASGRGYWHARYADAAKVYRDRYNLVGLFTDPMRRDRGTVEAFARDLLRELPPRAWLIDDVSIYYQLDFLRSHEDVRRDLRVLLLQPLGMADWGQSVAEVVNLGSLCPARLFIVATNGPCTAAVTGFSARGRQPVRFPLSEGHQIFELVPIPAAASSE